MTGTPGASTPAAPAAPVGIPRGDWWRIAAAAGAAIVAGACALAGAPPLLTFVACAGALSVLAMVVARSTDQIGAHVGPGVAGVMQGAFGNLPELFVSIFALRAGLVGVVQAAIVGSILANLLLVLGLAILVGGLRHGTQHFVSEPPRMVATLMLLVVAALALPTLAHRLHTPAAVHEEGLSAACAVVLLVVFAASLPFSLRQDPAISQPARRAGDEDPQTAPIVPRKTAKEGAWPFWMALVVLGGAGAGAAVVSEWFVDALLPAAHLLHLSDTFTGLVVVAVAGNAVENAVGVQLAARDEMDFALSVILNSALQVALALGPVLVLLSFVLGGGVLTLVLPPLLLAALVVATVIALVIVYDGESIWLEGVALIGLYLIIAAAFWWG